MCFQNMQKSKLLIVFILLIPVVIFNCYFMQISEVGKQFHKVMINNEQKLFQHIQNIKEDFETRFDLDVEDNWDFFTISSNSDARQNDWEMTGAEIMNILNTNQSGSLNKDTSSDYLISTPGCKLYRTAILPKNYGIKKLIIPNCHTSPVILTLDPISQILQLHPNYTSNESNDSNDTKTKDTCTVTEILTQQDKDLHEYGTIKNIKNTLDMSETELFVTKCGNLTQFSAHFPLTGKVQEKIKYWESQKHDDKTIPFSILFVGIDTTSRSHFFRGIPKTLNVLQQMGFADFMGYHSVAPYTLENLLAILVGWTTNDVRAKCAESWGSYFDPCPFIWKNYNENKFVTLFMEDGSQSFNWGNEHGFSQRPTDYYTHPLFISVKPYRKEHKIYTGKTAVCLSNMNDQQFMLDYIKRFVKKIQNIPFFSFTWFANPFHGNTDVLHGFDVNLTDFFQILQSSKELLKRTMIVLVSDHGKKHGSFLAGIENFLERTLPGLFIRLPDLLLTKYPLLKLRKILGTNTRRLTTPFDIQYTFQHLLILAGLNISSNISTAQFQPVMKDRSSLLVPISENRDCNSVNIDPGACVCNASNGAMKGGSSVNPFMSNKMINFAIRELNNIIKASQYKDDCSSWGKWWLSLISNDVVSNTTNTTDTVLKFRVTPAKSEFEVRLRIIHDNSTNNSSADRYQRLSNFTRITMYNETSWCVKFETDQDKKMKELCYCKKKKPKNEVKS